MSGGPKIGRRPDVTAAPLGGEVAEKVPFTPTRVQPDDDTRPRVATEPPEAGAAEFPPDATPATFATDGAVPMTHAHLEDCAKALIAHLPLLGKMAMEEAYIGQRIPLWAFLLGHVNGAYERGLFAAPILDPSWPRTFPGVGSEIRMDYVCKQCQTPFTGLRIGQQYCSQDCGQAANDRQAAEERAAEAADQARREADRAARGAAQPARVPLRAHG